MAQVLADDLDHTVDSPETPVLPWSFWYGPRNSRGNVFNIDLTEANFQRLTDALADFSDKAQIAPSPKDHGPTLRAVAALMQTLDEDPKDDNAKLAALDAFVLAVGSVEQGEQVAEKIQDQKPKRQNLSAEQSAKFKEATKKHAKAKREQRDDIRDWAKGQQDWEASAPKDKGIIKSDLLAAFYAANPEQSVYFGAEAVAAPVREDFLH